MKAMQKLKKCLEWMIGESDIENSEVRRLGIGALVRALEWSDILTMINEN